MEYKKHFKVSEITDIKPSENSHKEILEWIAEKAKNVPYAPYQFKPDYFIPDLDKESTPHWGCPPANNEL